MAHHVSLTARRTCIGIALTGQDHCGQWNRNNPHQPEVARHRKAIRSFILKFHELASEDRGDCAQRHEHKRHHRNSLHTLILRLHQLAVTLRDDVERHLDDVRKPRIQTCKPSLRRLEQGLSVFECLPSMPLRHLWTFACRYLVMAIQIIQSS